MGTRQQEGSTLNTVDILMKLYHLIKGVGACQKGDFRITGTEKSPHAWY